MYKEYQCQTSFQAQGKNKSGKLWLDKLLESSTTKREDVVMCEGIEESLFIFFVVDEKNNFISSTKSRDKPRLKTGDKKGLNCC